MPEPAAGSMRFSRSRVQQAGALALLLASLGFVVGRCALSPQIPFVRQSASMPWIMPGAPVTAALQQWGRGEVPVARFERRFRPEPSGGALLRVRALRRFQVYLNGSPLEGARGDGTRWRAETRVDLAGRLRGGENVLRVDVSNAHGPPLLSLRLEATGEGLTTGADWSVSVDGGPARPAILADDTRPNPASYATETPLEALGRSADTLLLLFVLGALGFGVGRRYAGAGVPGALPVAALLAASAGWILLLWEKVSRIPAAVGFDARHHLAYVDFLRSEHALPLATDGWSTFHPPLFYLLSLATGESQLARKALPCLAGLGVVWVVGALARRLFPEDARTRLLAVVFAAVLPMNLYTSAYFSNESLHTLLASVAIAATLALLLAERSGAAGAAAVGAAFGLAALVKFTVLLVVPAALVLLAAKWWLVERAPFARTLRRAGAFTLAFLAVAGWFYARNWIAFGTPVLGNWELPGAERVWWQQPGFHTLAWYTGFGQSLVHPYLSGFCSFWDAVYSTFWGDGFVAGRVAASDRHAFWSYDFMSAGYVVALPATALLGLGALLALRAALADPDPRRRAAFSFLTAASWVVAVAFLYLTLRLPFYAQAKAAYTLLLAGPFAVFFALGATRLDQALAPWPPARAAFWGWVAVFAGALFLGFAG